MTTIISIILASLAIILTVGLIQPKDRVETLLKSGDWDEYFREIGNVVEKDGTYYFYYTGHKGKNEKGKSDIYVGVATSKDLKTWTKQGKVMELPGEDPHVIVKNGMFWMFYEDKTDVPDVRTSVALSSDGIHFKRSVYGFLNPTTGWQSESASSPAAIVVDNDIKILYEGYGKLPDGTINQGQIGFYEHGKQGDSPVFIGSGDPKKYDQFVATDDVVKVGDKYFMSYHTLQAGVKWTAAVAWSYDLKEWHRPEAPQFDYGFNDMTVMFFPRNGCFDFILTDKDKKSIGIYRNSKVANTGLPVCK